MLYSCCGRLVVRSLRHCISTYGHAGAELLNLSEMAGAYRILVTAYRAVEAELANTRSKVAREPFTLRICRFVEY